MKTGKLTVDLRITSPKADIYDENGKARARNIGKSIEGILKRDYPASEHTVKNLAVTFEEDKPQPRYRAEKSGDEWTVRDKSHHDYPTVMRVSEEQATAIANLLNDQESTPPPPTPRYRAKKRGEAWCVEDDKGQTKVWDVTNYMANYLAAYFNGEARIVVNT